MKPELTRVLAVPAKPEQGVVALHLGELDLVPEDGAVGARQWQETQARNEPEVRRHRRPATRVGVAIGARDTNRTRLAPLRPQSAYINRPSDQSCT